MCVCCKAGKPGSIRKINMLFCVCVRVRVREESLYFFFFSNLLLCFCNLSGRRLSGSIGNKGVFSLLFFLVLFWTRSPSSNGFFFPLYFIDVVDITIEANATPSNSKRPRGKSSLERCQFCLFMSQGIRLYDMST